MTGASDATAYTPAGNRLPSGAFRSLFSLTPIAEGSDWYEVLSVGRRYPRPAADSRGAISITSAMIDEIARNWIPGDERPIDVDHARALGRLDPAEAGARGWIVGCRRDGDRLLARIRWTDEGRRLIRDGAYQWPSVEIEPVRDPATGVSRGLALTGATLTNHPLWDVPRLVASTGQLAAHFPGIDPAALDAAAPSGGNVMPDNPHAPAPGAPAPAPAPAGRDNRLPGPGFRLRGLSEFPQCGFPPAIPLNGPTPPPIPGSRPQGRGGTRASGEASKPPILSSSSS
jgi:hypothetical protein